MNTLTKTPLVKYSPNRLNVQGFTAFGSIRNAIGALWRRGFRVPPSGGGIQVPQGVDCVQPQRLIVVQHSENLFGTITELQLQGACGDIPL